MLSTPDFPRPITPFTASLHLPPSPSFFFSFKFPSSDFFQMPSNRQVCSAKVELAADPLIVFRQCRGREVWGGRRRKCKRDFEFPSCESSTLEYKEEWRLWWCETYNRCAEWERFMGRRQTREMMGKKKEGEGCERESGRKQWVGDKEKKDQMWKTRES